MLHGRECVRMLAIASYRTPSNIAHNVTEADFGPASLRVRHGYNFRLARYPPTISKHYATYRY